MIYINEWLPNPEGSDAAGEWVELWNSGETPTEIDGWQIVADGKSKFSLSAQSLEPDAYFVLSRSESKLVLKNMDGKLALFDSRGRLVDAISFVGSAPEGKSVNRFGAEARGAVRFGNPTPGAPNEIAPPSTASITTVLPADGRLINSLGGIEALWLVLFGALAVAGFVTYATKKHGYISELFFGKY